MKNALKQQEHRQQEDRSKAVIYCRVSGGRQAKEGDGLNSQERRCSDYAKQQGWEVISVYHETAVSGSLLDQHTWRLTASKGAAATKRLAPPTLHNIHRVM